ncbi:MAG: ribosomal protein S18-alanine N-acetyltransferase [Mesorhizobium sp.]
MRLPFISRQREYMIERLERVDADRVALLHREDFVRPWSATEFAELIDQQTVFGFAAREVGRKGDMAGFALARLAAGEAEILSIAVARANRREGLGRELMDAVLRQLHAERASHLLLEVDETNVAAIALYRRIGFAQVGKRPGYYAGKDGAPATGALVMRRDVR